MILFRDVNLTGLPRESIVRCNINHRLKSVGSDDLPNDLEESLLSRFPTLHEGYIFKRFAISRRSRLSSCGSPWSLKLKLKMAL